MRNSKTDSDKKKQTIKYYQQNAEEWARTHHGYEKDSYWYQEIQQFNHLLPEGKVLEIGCGPGRDAEVLIDLGYDYTGIDPSLGLLKIARKRNPKAEFIKMAIEDLDFSDQKFDGFFTAATLLHIPKKEVNYALKKIKAQIKPGGVGFISLKQGIGEEEDPKTGRWFSYYSEKEFQKILEVNGYTVLDTKIRPEQKTTWLCFWVKT